MSGVSYAFRLLGVLNKPLIVGADAAAEYNHLR